MTAKFSVERWNQYYAPNPAMLRLLLEHEGYRVFQWGDSSGAVIALHKNAAAISHWVISGTLEMAIGGEIYVLAAGDRDFLSAETWHSARVVGEEPVVYLIGEKLNKVLI
jgi:quercetin dioxygenase-like cupin family protein